MNKKAVKTGKKKPIKLLNREISWLAFNARVLQEAADPNVPLLERVKFLGIFSNNLDEFFRVRVAAVRRLAQLKKFDAIERKKAKKVLADIRKTVVKQQEDFERIYHKMVLPELAKNNIHIVDERALNATELETVRDHFRTTVAQKLFPLMLDENMENVSLKDGEIYLAVKLRNSHTGETAYSLVQIPARIFGRFYILPGTGNDTKIILLDDIIRSSLDALFKSLDFDTFTAHTIKLTRDAELDFDSDLGISLPDKVEKSLKQRKTGAPTRFLYDQEIPAEFLKYLLQRLKVDKQSAIPGGKYHNFRDFIKFPAVGARSLQYEKVQPLRIATLDSAKSILNEVEKHDVLVSYPYQSFDYIIRMLREAAIDPTVFAIHISLYRIAENSSMAEALINAVHNGKKVTVVMEVRARFMEEHNIYWTNRLREEGAHVIHGVLNYKIHSKIIVISRRRNYETSHICHIGTGNFNEDTARLYCDHALLTSRKRIANECMMVFDLVQNFKPEKYYFKALMVSPINTRIKFLAMLDREIKHASMGLEARAIIKVNSLVDEESCLAILAAAKKGVKIDLIVRGICCLPLTGSEKNIRAVSIIDKYLEHARVFYFENGGKPEVYMGSADLMQRNLEYRIEVTTKIHDKKHKQLLLNLLELQLSDNSKARILTKAMKNEHIKRSKGISEIRSQVDGYKLFAAEAEG